MFNRFQRRLNEALASAVGGGIDAPIYTGDFGDDDHHFELTPEQVRAIYKWVERADSTILRPVLSVMEELTPELSSRLQVSPAGRGSTYFTGTADYKARWVVKHGDISYSTIESQVGAVLRNSDIWKALGVDYNRAQSFLNNSDFWYHGMRALAFKLNSMKHAGFWAHVSSGQIGRVVNRQIRLEIDRPNNNRLVYNPEHLRKIGVQWRVEPDSLKVSSGKRPSTLQVDHVPTAGLSYRGPDDVAPITLNSSGQHVLFLLVAQLSYDFVGSIDLIRGGGSDGFSALPVEQQRAIVYGLSEVIEVAWEDGMGADLEIDLVGPDMEPDVYGDVLTYTILDWQPYFEGVDAGALAGALPALPPGVLHLIHQEVDTTPVTREARELMVDTRAVLGLQSAELGASGLTIVVKVDDVTVE